MDEDDDRCYECEGYGNDYYMDGNGDWIKACDDCPYNVLAKMTDCFNG